MENDDFKGYYKVERERDRKHQLLDDIILDKGWEKVKGAVEKRKHGGGDILRRTFWQNTEYRDLSVNKNIINNNNNILKDLTNFKIKFFYFI